MADSPGRESHGSRRHAAGYNTKRGVRAELLVSGALVGPTTVRCRVGSVSRKAVRRFGMEAAIAPLRGVWQHPPYFHNGIAATLDDVVDLYNSRQGLNLTAGQELDDLVQYLKSL